MLIRYFNLFNAVVLPIHYMCLADVFVYNIPVRQKGIADTRCLSAFSHKGKAIAIRAINETFSAKLSLVLL